MSADKSSSKSSSEVTVTMRRDSYAHKAGDEVKVDKKTADKLVRDGHADAS